ncbi:MAG: sugar ABC transporter substrate-binding protein [Roseiarcus sp.]|jgi:simple sugar transport system substrate-binding protein|uniref:sugar ABC transporter substrate-binding protein n=1 Tax=Roseiarcus sp. TaxID=1969460 RepID=UPI003BB1816D
MVKRTIALQVLTGVGAAALSFALAGTAAADDKLNIVYTHHSSASNPFWQAVKKGFDDACAKIQANCQMVFTQTEGSIDQEVANQQAALARKPDALITTLVDNNAFVANLKDAKAKGVIVIASNVDATEGPELELRQAFVGQNFVPAGTTLGRRMAALFPKDGPIRVLVGVNSPGQNWSEQRAKGIMNGLEEFKKANPNREITIDRLDVSADGAIVSDRVGAYLSAHPDTTAYIETGLWHSNVARMLKDRNIAPGKILLGGFDLAPQVIEQMKAGYIQVEIDQQPYEQGFLPVMQVYLEKKVGLAPADIDSGEAVFTPEQADQLMDLAKQGVR